MKSNYKEELGKLQDKIACTTGILGDMHNKMLLEGDVDEAQAIGDAISNITRSFYYVKEALIDEEDK